MDQLERTVRELAEQKHFSGVVRVDRGDDTQLAVAFGLAERGLGVETGALTLDTPVRRILGTDLPEVDDRVTVEHLLAHRSGIGDYLDEDAEGEATDYVMPVPVHELATTEAYLPVLSGHPQKHPPGEGFSYCNSGYVVLALVAERVSGRSFYELVEERVTGPAGMVDTAFLRSDELPGSAARGYLEAEGPRTNVLHLPVRGSGDGGVYSTAADLHRLWQSVLEGAVVSRESVAVSCRSVHDRSTDTTFTVVSNTTYGAWPLVRHLRETLLG